MKKAVLILGTIVLFCGTVFGQGSAPSVPSPFLGTNTSIYNPQPVNSIFFYLGDQTTHTTAYLYKSGVNCWFAPYNPDDGYRWWIGNSGAPWDRGYFDSLYVTNRFTLGSQTYTSFLGTGLQNVGGVLTPTLGNSINSGEIVDSTILPADLAYGDTSFVVGSIHRGANTTDSAYMTKNYIDNNVGGRTLLAGTPSNAQVLTWDESNTRVYWTNPPGAAGGDNITIDELPYEDSVVQVTDPIFRGALELSGDTITFTGAGVSPLADTIGSDTSIYNFSYATLDSVGVIHADSIDLTSSLTLTPFVGEGAGIYFDDPYGTTVIDGVASINGNDNHTFNITAGSGTSAYMSFNAATSQSIRFNYAGAEKFRMAYDTLFGRASGGSVMKGMKCVVSDSLILPGGRLWSDADWVTEAEEASTLASYVPYASENWRDGGQSAGSPGDSVIQHSTTFTGGTMSLTIRQTLNSSDTTYMIPSTGSLVLKSGTTSGDIVKLEGATGNTEFDSRAKFNAGILMADTTTSATSGNIDSVNVIDADTLNADYAIQLQPSGSSTSNKVTIKASPSTSSAYQLVLPSTAGTNGYALVTDGSGGLSWSAAAGGGTAWYISDSIPLIKDTVALQIKDSLATYALQQMVTDTSALIRDKVVPFGTRVGSTTYDFFDGSDSVWMPSTSGNMLYVTASHSGADTTRIHPPSGDGLVLGNDEANGVTILAEDTTRIMGVVTVDTGFSVNVETWDSLWQNIGGFRGSGGTSGDITAVGSMATGDAFNSSSADGAWLGLGAAAGRLEFDAGGAGIDDDQVSVRNGRLMVGDTLDFGEEVKRGIYIGYPKPVGTSGPVGLGVKTWDSANGAHSLIEMKSLMNNAGTSGGSAYSMYELQNTAGTRYSIWTFGALRSTTYGYPFVISRDATLGNNLAFAIDSLRKVIMPAGAYKGTDTTADSALPTWGRTKVRIPWTQNATDIIWNYPTDPADTSQHATFPYPVVYDTTHLVKCTTTTGNDTLFGLIIPFYISDSITVDSLVMYVQTSSAVANESKIDSLHITYETPATDAVVALTSSSTDWYGTSMTRYKYGSGSYRTALPGEIIRVRPAIALTANNSWCIIHKAMLYGRKRS